MPLPAPGLLSWQLLALADYKNANKVLDRARTINKCGLQRAIHPVPLRLSQAGQALCPTSPATAQATPPGSSLLSSPELMDFKSHGSSFHENLTELGQLELKHTKVSPPASRSPLAAFLSSHPGSLVSWQLGAEVELVGVGGIGWQEHPSCAGPGLPVLTRTLPFSPVARPQCNSRTGLRTGVIQGGATAGRRNHEHRPAPCFSGAPLSSSRRSLRATKSPQISRSRQAAFQP